MTVLGFAALAAPALACAQSEDDIKTLDRARSHYLVGPVPASIACGVALDWDTFFDRMKIERTDEVRQRIQKLSTIHISVVTRGATDTDVKVEASDSTPAFDSVTDGLKLQLQGFFQMYWSEAYGRLIAKRGDKFTLERTADGYVQKASDGLSEVSIVMNKEFVITEYGLKSPQMSAEVTPTFKPGADGLLRLRQVDQTTDIGPSKLVVSIKFDYQNVQSYEVPQHITMELPGSYSFDYTLTDCKVNSAPAAAETPAAAEKPSPEK